MFELTSKAIRGCGKMRAPEGAQVLLQGRSLPAVETVVDPVSERALLFPDVVHRVVLVQLETAMPCADAVAVGDADEHVDTGDTTDDLELLHQLISGTVTLTLITGRMNIRETRTPTMTPPIPPRAYALRCSTR